VADVGLIRKRLRHEIDAGRRAAATRRERAAAVSRAFDTFLADTAIPAFRAMANVLRAEGLPFEAQTPSGAVRLVSDRNRDDAIALSLDDTQDPPQPMLVTTRARGSRMIRTERPVKEGADIDRITEDEVIERLIEELRPWLE
jgi:hypothetical protein